jgi:hypothetical protein
MPLPDAVRREIYDRARGQCECTRQHDGLEAPHQGERCPSRFSFASGSGLTDWWDANYIQPESSGGPSTADNTEALCGACFELVQAEVASGSPSR